MSLNRSSGSTASGALAAPPAPSPAAPAGGLSPREAAARLEAGGPNVLPVPPSPSAWRALLEQMVHFFALLLWGAGALAIVAGMPALGVAIFVVVLVNGAFAYVQEHRAERAAEQLRGLLPRRVTVVRGGRPVEIDATELVVGDLVVLGAGDRISCDATLVEAHAVTVDASSLTGESAPVSASVGDPVFAGTFTVQGYGRAVVTATGAGTRLAAIAQLTRAGTRPASPLARELHRVVRAVAAIAVGVGVAFFAIALLVGTPARDGFLFAVGVTVALVPEGLLPTVTLSLAMGAQRMATRHALVRHLESVETLGSTTFICTDKTGTLTQNQMAAVSVWTPAGAADLPSRGYDPTAALPVGGRLLPALTRVAVAGARCSDGRVVATGEGWHAQGDPMEAALDVLARRVGVDVDATAAEHAPSRRFPFDAVRRRMSLVVDGELLVKGAPDAVLPRCSPAPGAQEAVHDMTARGLRVLAVATGSAPEADVTDADAAERDLTLLGVVGFEDPPRPHAAASIAACRQAGIRVAMVTGDHPDTAAAIAREVGLAGPDGLVLQGRDLPADDAVLGALLDRDGVVVSRVTPEDKLRIARALQSRGHVVAMTGDGVNDGPALQQADIGVAMGRTGTDVAREAADLVLLDDDFATIVAAVEQGRATFTNVRRFLTYHLTDNVAELTPFVVWALSGGRFPLALGVLQILCLDIGTDLLPALGLGAEPPSKGVLRSPPVGRHLFDKAVATRVFGVLGPVEAVIEMAAFVTAMAIAGWRPGDSFPEGSALAAASGAAFTAVVFGQMANAFACRSATRWPGALGWRTNPLIVGAVAVELVLLAMFLYLPAMASLLDHAPPPAGAALVALLVVPTLLAADAMHKAYRRRRGQAAASPPVSPVSSR